MPRGNLVALDFGITGRLSEADRLFLAEILYGFITRNYRRIAQVHFDAGYVPASEDVETFAQALRAIGEPIMGLPADQISMSRLLTQLFEVTEQFNMETQPQLLLLQKTMVVTEGVARTLNPNLNIWKSGEPVVKQWIERKLGPLGKVEQVLEGAGALSGLALRVPRLMEEAEDFHRKLNQVVEQQTAAAQSLAHAAAGRLCRGLGCHRAHFGAEISHGYSSRKICSSDHRRRHCGL